MPSTLQTNPLQAIMRSGPSAPPMAPGGAASPPPGAAPGLPGGGGGLVQSLASMFAQQQQAEPDFLLKQLTTTRQMLVEMIPKAMVSVEGVAADLGALLRPLDKTIEKLKKAATAKQLARPPIGFSAAQSSNAPGGGGGMGQFPSGGLPQSGP